MLSLVLYNIRSAHNVGSIFRTGDAVGVKHVYLTGYTPTPVDRFQNKRKDVAKVALGAEDAIPWTSHEHILDLLHELKAKGVKIYALEQSEKTKDYRDESCKISSLEGDDVAVILGEEVKGIGPDILALCDDVLEIPMRGSKESLNVSVATGILLFEITRNIDK